MKLEQACVKLMSLLGRYTFLKPHEIPERDRMRIQALVHTLKLVPITNNL